MGGPIACAVVNSRLDYANAMLYGTSKSNIDKLQRVRNAMAKIVTNTRRISQHIRLALAFFTPLGIKNNNRDFYSRAGSIVQGKGSIMYTTNLTKI